MESLEQAEGEVLFGVGEAFQGAWQSFGLGGGYLGCLPLPGDRFFESVEVLGGFTSSDRSETHGVGAEQSGSRSLVLFLRHAA